MSKLFPTQTYSSIKHKDIRLRICILQQQHGLTKKNTRPKNSILTNNGCNHTRHASHIHLGIFSSTGKLIIK